MAGDLDLGEITINSECEVWWARDERTEVTLSYHEAAKIKRIIDESGDIDFVDLSIDLKLRTWENCFGDDGVDCNEGTLTEDQNSAILKVVLGRLPECVEHLYLPK